MKVKTFLENTAHLPSSTVVRNSCFNKEFTESERMTPENSESIEFHLNGSTYKIDICWERPKPEHETTLGMMREMQTEVPVGSLSASYPAGTFDIDIKVDIEDGFVYAHPKGIVIKDNMVIIY